MPALTARSRVVAAVFAVLLGVYGLTNPGLLNTVDAWPTIAEAAAIVETGSVHYSRLDAAAVGPELQRATQVHSHSHFGLGQNLVFVPLYAAARTVAKVSGRPPLTVAKAAFSFSNAVAGAAVGALLAATLLELGFASVAVAVTLGVCFGSFLWPLSGISYSDPLQTAVVVAVLLQALRTRRTGLASDVHLLGAIGLAASSVKPFHAVTAALLALPCLANPAVRRTAVVAALGWGAAAVAVFGFANWLRFGSPTDSGYAESMLDFRPAYGFRLLLVSFDRGLVWFFPLLPAAIWGLVRFARRDAWTAWSVLAAIGIDFLLVVSFQDRHGGNCLGPRYLLFVVPLSSIGLAHLVDVAGPAVRRAWTGLLVLSAIWVLPMALLQWYLAEVVDENVVRAGGTPLAEPAPFKFHRLLLAKTVCGPDRIELQRFSSTPVAGTLDLVHHDHAGWQAWWIKPHPAVPDALRWSGAAGLAVVALWGALSLRPRVLAPTTAA